jgi:hypothetical protein
MQTLDKSLLSILFSLQYYLLWNGPGGNHSTYKSIKTRRVSTGLDAIVSGGKGFYCGMELVGHVPHRNVSSPVR